MKALIVLILTVVPTLTLAANDTNYQAEIDAFFTLYQNEQIDDAVDAIYRSNPYIVYNSEQVTAMKTRLAGLKELVGNIHHIDKLNTYKVGENFLHLTYIVIYDKQPIRYEFQFFKIAQSWRIHSFSYDDKLTSDIADLARKAALAANKE